MLRNHLLAVGVPLVLVLAGCGGDTEMSQTNSSSNSGPSAAGAKYVLASEPAGATDVIAARENAEDDAEIVVVGRIGGAVNPWVDDMAAFTIVDNSLLACSDIEGDQCPTPWDYCCEADVADGRVMVKFVGDDGRPLATDARQLLGLTELQTVVVQGTAARDEDGNLTILASNLYVRPDADRPQVSAEDHGHSHDHDHSHAHEHEEEEGEEHAHEESDTQSSSATSEPQ